MDEDEMVRLPEQDVQKIERVNESFARREEAEAAKEAQKKLRVLFERTAQEALPFVVYVIYMGAMGLVVVFRLLDFEGTKLWLGAALVTVVMLAPIALLPRANLWWRRRRLRNATSAEGRSMPAPQVHASSESE